ncbi:iron complex outermembrane recepter protein [Arenibacter palladensis]|uniref:Iron complex outermembrane recepter protein n=1 Tax=Arenibacter palladensis TaxID=237373 RepID=A0A1M5FGG1_9FLAO|nr:TonB-dependent receptor [Arenibacter palladensis]SHF90241.1 iron complex outermembrane recepter protein [Arenibacter palladensis]
MEKKQIFLFFIGLLAFAQVFGQSDGVIVLDEVVLSDAKLLHFSKGAKIRVVNDSIQQKSGSSLTDLLRYNSNIYFKENGYGMVSSASFRGTNAQQTAVVWNGININSQLTGQTDFNTLIPGNYGDVVVRSGGGSVQYGSGAVGGTVLLNDSFKFNEGWRNSLETSYGSFNTSKLAFNTSLGKEKTFFHIGINHIASDNDYKYLGTNRRNENGAYDQLNLNANVGFILSDQKVIKLYHNTFSGDRDFSGTLTAPADENYRDLNHRSLIELSSFNERKIARLKVGHLYERYRYFPNKQREEFSFGQANTVLANYDYKYQLNKITLNGIIDFSSIWAKGTSIENAQRNFVSGTFLFSHELSDKFNYGLNLRQEAVSDYQSPFLFSLSSSYKVTGNNTLSLNASKNYRVPTFNDLYWTGAAASGNLEVLPETSWQVELGQTIQVKNIALSLNAYSITTDNLIQWRPNTQGIWMAMNVQDVSQYGLELGFDWKWKWEDQELAWESEYAFTKSLDNATKNQLLYVPEHLLRSNVAYQFKKWVASYQFLYNGSVYTTTDNSDSLPSYTLGNLGLDYHLSDISKIKFILGMRVNNLYNKNYQNVAYRPMPNRNFQLQLITKF